VARARVETPVLMALLGAMLALKIACAFSTPVDSDEPQHLHVAWAWTQGLLPYRDVFDNHAPLFHVLSAPILALFGETSHIIVLMRLAMLPFFATALYGSFLLGRRLFGARAGIWSAVVCGLCPTFFLKSVEYRSDVPWAALWVLTVVLLFGGRLRARRAALVGLLAGTCVILSLKSIMLLAALGFATLSVLVLLPRERTEARRRAFACALPFLGGALVPAAIVVLFFAARGALAPMIDCTIKHNLLPDVGRWGSSKRQYLVLPLLGLLFVAARFIIKGFPGEGARIAFLLLLSGSQYILLSTVWPVHTRQDLLPFYPLFAVLLAGVLLARHEGAPGGSRSWSWSAGRAALLPGALACLELLLVPALTPIRAHGTAKEETLLREVLTLTDRKDYVLDLKGQAVYRNRPFYYALETMTLRRMERGLIEDTIPERCVATRTCVAPADIRKFPPRARAFLRDHYVVVDGWRVAGVVLEPGAGQPAAGLPFDVVIPARYAILSETNRAPGSIDGLPYEGPRDLATGRHELQPSPGTGRVAVIWAQAAERGFSPFAPAGRTP
jgi:dolichyl-phosphate-mannose-protein mannosyltransferase